MGVQTATRHGASTASSAPRSDNQQRDTTATTSSKEPPPSEAEFTSLLDEAMKRAAAQEASDSSAGSDAAAKAAAAPGKSITKDEQQKFLKAMQDPEFRSLLNDYMAEISDPANRAETERYLSQLEQEQHVPEGKLLLKPVPGFVVKTKWGQAQRKVFVNVCSSDKLQPPSSTPVPPSAGVRAGGTSWSLPYSVGPERVEGDKGGAPAIAYDVCFHTRTLQFAAARAPFRDMVVKTSLDAVEALLRETQREPKGELSRAYHVLKGVAYKSGEPVTMCLNTNGAAAVKGDAPSTMVPAKATAKTPSPAKQREKLEPKASTDDVAAVLGQDRAAMGALGMPSTAAAAAKPLIQEVASTTSTAPMRQVATKFSPPPPQRLPELTYRVIYRGRFEMMDHMQGQVNGNGSTTHTPPPASSRPKELVVEIAFPNHASAAGIDLDVNDTTVKVTTKGYAPLAIALPFAVIEAKGSARFDKKSRKLVVTLPVQPPPKAPETRMVIEEDASVEEAEEAEHENQLVQELEDTSEIAIDDKSKVAEDATMIEKTQPRPVPDDAFAMLRETALMVANDPLYMPRPAVIEPITSAREEANDGSTTASEEMVKDDDAALEDKVKVYTSSDAVYDDLPPLESCSEDEGDKDDGPEAVTDAAIDAPQFKAENDRAELAEVVATSAAPRVPTYTIKETPWCRSFLVEVAAIEKTSTALTFPTSTTFLLKFTTTDGTEYALQIEDLPFSIDTSRSECAVATENAVVMLRKLESPVSQATEIDAASSSTVTAPPPPPPVVRFQNDLLYELD